eukprot:1156503-Pelagomonas_calceolata.AAC.7
MPIVPNVAFVEARDELVAELKRRHADLLRIFDWYACLGSGDPFSMQFIYKPRVQCLHDGLPHQISSETLGGGIILTCAQVLTSVLLQVLHPYLRVCKDAQGRRMQGCTREAYARMHKGGVCKTSWQSIKPAASNLLLDLAQSIGAWGQLMTDTNIAGGEDLHHCACKAEG